MQHYCWRECFGYRRATGEKTQASQETIPEEIDEQGEEIADSCIPTHRKKLRVRGKLGFHLNSARNAVQPPFWAQGLPQLWSLWQCKNCGYHGALILENGNLAAKLN